MVSTYSCVDTIVSACIAQSKTVQTGRLLFNRSISRISRASSRSDASSR
jgi:hypothetical protein